MTVKVRIPAPLQRFTNNVAATQLEVGDMQELFQGLDKEFPELRGRIFDREDRLSRFIHIYVNEKEVRFLPLDAIPLKEGDEVTLIFAIAGG